MGDACTGGGDEGTIRGAEVDAVPEDARCPVEQAGTGEDLSGCGTEAGEDIGVLGGVLAGVDVDEPTVRSEDATTSAP